MSRNITTAQKSGLGFQKSDASDQTNQIKYDCFFLAGHRKHKIIYSRSKIRNKNPGLVFWILYCSLISQWKNLAKNNLVKLELPKEISLSPEYPNSEIW